MRHVIDGVTLIDGSGAAARRGARIVIDGAFVAQIDEATTEPAAPLFAMPGLVDAHAHAETPEAFAALLAHGVTTIRNPATAGDAPLRAPEPTLGPHVVAAGPAIDHAARAADLPSICPADDAAAVRRAVARHVEAGFDWIKLYNGLTPAMVRAGVDAAHAAERAVLGDLVATSWREAAELGIDGLCHAVPRHAELLRPQRRHDYAERCASGKGPAYLHWLELLDVDSDEVARTADVLARRSVCLDVTLVALEAALLHADPRYRDQVGLAALDDTPPAPAAVLQRLRRAFEVALAFVGVLHRRGVTIISGSDTPRHLVAPGRSLQRELVLLGQVGLSAAETLTAATADAARALLGPRADRGLLRPGMRADLLLLRADPLADVRHLSQIDTVFVGGQPLMPAG